ncbi:hypothetical protein AB0E08_08435 [Streptomyces sp. NPDC048281]|uniref:hypothetical protein n=1 Tax=Streptomyces sp. NPDC048281 TaxID=3154715 RepID=UPI003449F492
MTDQTADTIRPRPRRMAQGTAESIHASITSALDELTAWKAAHPNVADWRIEEAATKLGRVQRLIGYLRDDTDPEGDAARARLRSTRDEESARGMGCR